MSCPVEVGKKYKIFYFKNNPGNRLIHIRGIVDGIIVYRFWNPRKHYWIYLAENPQYFEMLKENGNLFDKGWSEDKPSKE